MQIHANNLGKRYNREWIFRNFSCLFTPEKKYAVTGPNGSGKSTLLQIIAGAIIHNEGTINYKLNNNPIPEENFHRHIAIAAPYLELIEEMTAEEHLFFHRQFKPLSAAPTDILTETGLAASFGKQIRYFSSGMKQRLKLAQAFYSSVPVLLLDEPTTNLDAGGIELYHHLLQSHTNNKIVIISSNDKEEYRTCTDIINITDYK